MSDNVQIVQLEPARRNAAVEVLVDAFAAYPVMRFLLGYDGGADASVRRDLSRLIGFFTDARFVRGDLVLAAAVGDRIEAVANVNRPGSQPPTHLAEPSEDPLHDLRETVWARLGAEARQRYDAYGEVTDAFEYPEPHYHLGMLGARRAAKGRGHGRLLLEAVHELAANDPTAEGVSLTTEDPRNVDLYRHFGYEIVGHGSLSHGQRSLESWGMFRACEPS